MKVFERYSLSFALSLNAVPQSAFLMFFFLLNIIGFTLLQNVPEINSFRNINKLLN